MATPSPRNLRPFSSMERPPFDDVSSPAESVSRDDVVSLVQEASASGGSGEESVEREGGEGSVSYAPPSFTVCCRGLAPGDYDRFTVLDPCVYYSGEYLSLKDENMGDEQPEFTFGDTVYCNVYDEGEDLDGDKYFQLANTGGGDSEYLVASVKIADIPTLGNARRGVRQYHVGTLILGAKTAGYTGPVDVVADVKWEGGTLYYSYARMTFKDGLLQPVAATPAGS